MIFWPSGAGQYLKSAVTKLYTFSSQCKVAGRSVDVAVLYTASSQASLIALPLNLMIWMVRAQVCQGAVQDIWEVESLAHSLLQSFARKKVAVQVWRF